MFPVPVADDRTKVSDNECMFANPVCQKLRLQTAQNTQCITVFLYDVKEREYPSKLYMVISQAPPPIQTCQSDKKWT